jgi:hypothetical protein
MHRRIVTSSTYRQSAVVNQESNEVDPEKPLDEFKTNPAEPKA